LKPAQVTKVSKTLLQRTNQAMMVQTCNPSYMGGQTGRSWLEAGLDKKNLETLSEKIINVKMAGRALA
jgi:hypothetical protein